MSKYDERPDTTNSDGSPVFASDAELERERDVANLVGSAWKCELVQFAPLCPIDYYAVRDGRVVGVVEIKSRSHASTEYTTVFFSFRKWLALMLAENGLGVPASYVVQFTDGIWWVRAGHVDASKFTISGPRNSARSIFDTEPIILLPVATMQRLKP